MACLVSTTPIAKDGVIGWCDGEIDTWFKNRPRVIGPQPEFWAKQMPMTKKRKRLRAFGMSSGERFVMLHHWLLRSAAWKSLTLVACSLLIEVWQRHNGENNGRISFSVREAAKRLRISKNTAAKAFGDLEAKSFLKAHQRGAFTFKQRHPTEWILTAECLNDELPSKDFMRWSPEPNKQNTVLLSRTDGPIQKDPDTLSRHQKSLHGPTGKDRQAQIHTSDGPAGKDTYNIPGRGCSNDQESPPSQSSVMELPPIPTFLDRRSRVSQLCGEHVPQTD